MTMLEAASPLLVWGTFTRLLGLVYLVAFASLYGQIVPLAGRRGVTPIGDVLDHARRDFPSWRCVTSMPTLLWLSSSDRALRGLVLIGAASSVVVVVGGETSRWALLVCWLAYLSFDLAAELMYPWDCVLFEAGFLALLLPSTMVLPSLSAADEPLPIVALAFNLLLIRVLLGFGKFKFVGLSRKDFAYTRDFLINQPIPTPLGWWAFRLPAWAHKLGLLGLFIGEIAAPPLMFFSGTPRLILMATTIALMAAIQVTANFGYFNLVMLVLTVPLLDIRAPTQGLTLGAATASFESLVTHGVVAVVLFGSILHFPFNSWCSRGWLYWPSLLAAPRPVRALLAFYRALMPFRIVHAYGVFPPESTPPIKFVPVIEGSADGQTWREYEYRYFPSTERSRPRWVAPHHPRLDHLCVYEGYGSNMAGFLGSIITYQPYMFSRLPPFVRLMARLAEPGSPVRSLFRRDPFDGEPPPTLLRMRLFALSPTTDAERRATGRWWHRHLIGTHYPAFAPGPDTLRDWLNGPELFHWDHLTWRRQAPAMVRFEAQAKAASGIDELERAVVDLLEVPPGLLQSFWSDFMPAIQPDAEVDLSCLQVAAAGARDRHGGEALRNLERVAAALALGLAARLDDRVFGASAKRLPLSSYMHLGLLAYGLVLSGRSAFATALVDPSRVEREAVDLRPAAGLWLMGIFRFETVAYHARCHALARRFVVPVNTPLVPGFAQTLPLLASALGEDEAGVPVEFSRAIADGSWCVTFRDAATNAH